LLSRYARVAQLLHVGATSTAVAPEPDFEQTVVALPKIGVVSMMCTALPLPIVAVTYRVLVVVFM
jgi:hypothetical protein